MRRLVSVWALSLFIVLSAAAGPARAENRPVARLVDLGAGKCVPCKQMAPVLDGLKADYAGRLDVEFIDVWLPENKGQAQKYGVTAIPTQVFCDSEGRELWRHVGFMSREDILAKFKALGCDLDAASGPGGRGDKDA